MAKFKVWSDSESKVDVNKDFNSLEKACDFACEFVHKYDGKPYRVIAYVENNITGQSIECCENINPCDVLYEEYLEQGMGFSEAQREAIEKRVNYLIGLIIPDAVDRSGVCETIMPSIFRDITECADWDSLGEDDWCEGDIDIAVARVIKEKVEQED